MKYRIIKISEDTYRIQEQVRQFVFFGKLVWIDMENIAECPWEGSLETAHRQLEKLVGRKKYKNPEVVHEITI